MAPKDPRDPEATKVSLSPTGTCANNKGGLLNDIEFLFQVNEAMKASQGTTEPRVSLDGQGRRVRRERKGRRGYRALQDSSASPALSAFL